jgi:transcriptional regulator with XRE-family HTH domain
MFMEFAEFGDTIKERRIELSMTQEQVADQVGVKPNYIGYLERGMRKPSDEICVRIADVLGLDQKDLFFLANPHVKEILQPAEKPDRSAWEVFTANSQLHKRQAITAEEMAFLEKVNALGEVQRSRDYLFILKAVRMALWWG